MATKVITSVKEEVQDADSELQQEILDANLSKINNTQLYLFRESCTMF